MKYVAIMAIAIFIIFAINNQGQQYHFDKNHELCDSLNDITSKYLDSAANSIGTPKCKPFLDSVSKYNAIMGYINAHTSIPDL